SVLGCTDSYADFAIAPGTCREASAFDTFLALADRPLPASICVKRFDAPPGAGVDLTILDLSPDTIHMRRDATRYMTSAFTGRLPSRTARTGRTAGSTYVLSLTVTDGNPRPVTATSSFLYHGEAWLVFNGPPTAALIGGGSVECAAGAGLVSLDGSA